MFGLGTMELVIILVIVVMLFGVGKLPLVAKQLGSGIREFQKSVRGEGEDEHQAKRLEEKPAETVAREEVAKKDEKSENSVIF